jgi:GNAT superfamily N-acetyltransferase
LKYYFEFKSVTGYNVKMAAQKKRTVKSDQLFRTEINVIEPFTKLLPKEYKLSAAREIEKGQDSIRYDIHYVANGQNVAYAVVKRVKGKFFLDGLFVLPEYRNFGLGSFLIHTVLSNHPWEDIYILARPFKDKSVQLTNLIEYYKKFGFEQYDKKNKGRMVKRAVKEFSQ